MNRSTFLAAASAASVASAAERVSALGTTVAGITVPDSPLARAATEIARAANTPEILAHSMRVFYFASLLGKAKGIAFDSEAVYVAAILHDVGLSPQHMSADRRFEVDGAMVARDLLKQHNVAPFTEYLVWDAIALHDQGAIALYKQPEVMLVSSGVNTDFGSYLDVLQRPDVAAVLAAEPRTNFIPSFLNTVAAYAKRKPNATGNSWITDVAYKMVPGFHLHNFVDMVTMDDPFAGY